MKRNILYILFFCLILVLSACTSEKQPGGVDDWENEVLWAENCGQDGLACCLDQDPSCKFGQTCCVSPLDPSKNYCADECGFGELDKFCRSEEPACDQGLICADYGRCAPCGTENTACCAESDPCSGGLVCFSQRCQTCGLPGNVCCSGSEKCQAEKKRDENRTECQINNICSFCGNGGQIACQAEPFCNPGNLFNSQNCFACGGSDQPCCQKNGENYCDSGLLCDRGFCS